MRRIGEPRGFTNKVRYFMQYAKSRGFSYAMIQGIRYLINKPLTYYEYLLFLIGFPGQWQTRLYVLRRFRSIHRAIPTGHTEGELLRIADEILRQSKRVEGDIVECGTSSGAATCKLSVIAKLTGRKLVACDSFHGLPNPREDETGYFKKEEYAATLDEVLNNLKRFGEIESTEILAGWFQETLPKLKGRKLIAVFEDADLYESVLCCVENLWPSLEPGCKMFTHEITYPIALRAYTDKSVWLRLFGYSPPPLLRVGKGLRSTTVNLGYIEKASKEGKSQ